MGSSLHLLQVSICLPQRKCWKAVKPKFFLTFPICFHAKKANELQLNKTLSPQTSWRRPHLSVSPTTGTHRESTGRKVDKKATKKQQKNKLIILCHFKTPKQHKTNNLFFVCWYLSFQTVNLSFCVVLLIILESRNDRNSDKFIVCYHFSCKNPLL